MPVKLNEIKGFPVDQEKCFILHVEAIDEAKCVICINQRGFNRGIQEQCEKQIGLNREKLALDLSRLIYCSKLPKHDFNILCVCVDCKDNLRIADAIIAQEAILLEYKEDK